MPAERNFLPRAQAMNRAIWKSYPMGRLDAFAAALEARADESQAGYLADRRERIETAIAECRDSNAAFLNHKWLRGLRAGNPMSSDEAVSGLLFEIAYQKNRPTYCRDPKRIADLKEALVFARWFRRHSRRAWARRAAA